MRRGRRDDAVGTTCCPCQCHSHRHCITSSPTQAHRLTGYRYLKPQYHCKRVIHTSVLSQVFFFIFVVTIFFKKDFQCKVFIQRGHCRCFQAQKPLDGRTHQLTSLLQLSSSRRDGDRARYFSASHSKPPKPHPTLRLDKCSALHSPAQTNALHTCNNKSLKRSARANCVVRVMSDSYVVRASYSKHST